MAEVDQKGKSGLDIEKAVKALDDNAQDESSGRCARFVREALLAGGVVISPHPVHAKEYDSYLLAKGFVALAVEGYVAEKGDVVVIQPYKGGSISGHIAMFDGTIWVSDFRQRDFWGGPGFRNNKPPYVVYRP